MKRRDIISGVYIKVTLTIVSNMGYSQSENGGQQASDIVVGSKREIPRAWSRKLVAGRKNKHPNYDAY